ncbi:B12-binding domain-containing radical SAM protein [Edaphobacter albus]|uniref:B12-binding domain-containing radical SAM protein n=1 Tax=Edaphobacter sp. 4G125 TaxID=2763071 RepID=UPI0016466136|nr:radical SAM protein [Edaphobacter sp. 4G125]QNI37657.1 B12-binding domain-containing radical SAM protein [Edaphobacter sp. 4G125]
MIILFHPRATKPRNCRMPLAVLALAAVLEGRERYTIVDGNLDDDPLDAIITLIDNNDVILLGVSVMPGPQMVAGMDLSREVRRLRPGVKIVWGGYFPSIYPAAALNARYVDYVVRGQGEETLIELIEAIRGQRMLSSIRGLSYKDEFGLHHNNAERPMKGPDNFPWSPYHRIPVERYLRPSFFGKRTAVHHASIGCPFNCSFCGVHAAYGRDEKMESPERTVSILKHLVARYDADSVQFYDMNFFLREDHTQKLCELIAPLNLRWWCEARVDIMSRYSDKTMAAIARAGCTMIFFGAESGADWVLQDMQKGITTEQTLIMAERTRRFGIIPEFSFVVGNPKDPDRDTRETLAFIRRIKRINPDSEIIIQHYTPTPQPGQMYGNVDDKIAFPSTPAEWATKQWMNFTLRIDTSVPWLRKTTKELIDNFELVVASRWPTVQDIRAPRWSRLMLKTLSAWRYTFRIYNYPIELQWAHNFINLRKPKRESL